MWRVLQGHITDVLRTLPEESVQCVVTSPPYWGLRAYKTAPQVWGGDPLHQHAWDHRRYYIEGGGGAGSSAEAFSQPGQANAQRIKEARWREDDTCSCGAWRGELGLEPTPELYVQHLVEVFREVRRVLRKDGTLWLNMGDSYAGSAQGWSKDKVYAGAKQATNEGSITRSWIEDYGYSRPPGYISSRQPNGLKPKDLVGVPWRVAFALQADGWWLRSDIIWAKPNPMPESVTDRPTKAHEYIFMLTRSERYYYDQEAVREPFTDATVKRVMQQTFHTQKGGPKDGLNPNRSCRRALENLRKQFDSSHGGGGTSFIGHSGAYKADGTPIGNPSGRNPRTVWTIPTQPFRGAHFATFPERLVEPCIKAGTSERGCCATCHAPLVRVIERSRALQHDSERQTVESGRGATADRSKHAPPRTIREVGWLPSCSCGGEPVPCTVLDPFCGSGTTGVVAVRFQRAFIGIELNSDFVGMANRRIQDSLVPGKKVKRDG